QRPAVGLGYRLLGAAAFVVDPDELAQADLALELGADEVERAGLGGEYPVAVEPPEHERPKAVRVAEADQLPLGEGRDRERSLEPRDCVHDRLPQRRRI